MTAAKRTPDDEAQPDVHAHVAERESKGYIGDSPSTIPNSEFSIQSGPKSPTAAEQKVAAATNRVNELKAGLDG